MEIDFWRQVWIDERIGFHASDVNQFLRSEFESLSSSPGDRILVPLCGMSRDMTWLADRGLDVVGVEISSVAVERYFRENELDPEVAQSGEFERFSAGGVTIYCGDFFGIGPRETGVVDRFYDRAALVAMPPEMRSAYAGHLRSLLAPNSRGLVVAMEHDRGNGPPFSVERMEVEQLFSRVGGVVPVASRTRRGVTSVAYLIGADGGTSREPGGEA